MERITAPILRNDRGSAVNNLQDGLILLVITAPAEPPDLNRQALIDKLVLFDPLGASGATINGDHQ